MPYKDPEKRKECHRLAKRNERGKEKLAPFMNGEDFDIASWLQSPEVKVGIAQMISAGLRGTKTNSNFMKLVMEVIGIYTPKHEETLRVEYSVGDIARDAEQIITYLRERLEAAGTCPVCCKPYILLDEVCSDKVN